jgi:hypothetical protein
MPGLDRLRFAVARTTVLGVAQSRGPACAALSTQPVLTTPENGTFCGLALIRWDDHSGPLGTSTPPPANWRPPLSGAAAQDHGDRYEARGVLRGIEKTLTKAGIEFLPADVKGEGVRLRSPRAG